MLNAFLAGSGGRVVIPDAVEVVDGETADKVRFVDEEGRVLVIFERADVALFSEDGANLEALMREPPSDTAAT